MTALSDCSQPVGRTYLAQCHAPVPLELRAQHSPAAGEARVTIRLHNPSEHIAFFERAVITDAKDGEELLPIEL